MNGVRVVAQSFCMALILSGIFSMLSPGRSMEKVWRFCLSLFLLCSLVFPFLQGGLDFSWDFSREIPASQTEPLQSGMEQSLKEVAQQKIASQLMLQYEKEHLAVEKVEVSIHIEDEESIDISEIQIQLAPGALGQKQAVVELTQKEAGVTPTIIES